MGIDFHNRKNRMTYTTRNVDHSWRETVKALVPIHTISKAADIGCGGGIYSKALADMGVASVTGVDFSKEMLEGAKENCKAYPNTSFIQGSAFDTGLANCSYDLLLERALIHHFEDLQACFKEAYRLLKDGGFFIIQDRTPEDCLLEGNDHHIRGYFFERFPNLKEVETRRRHQSPSVIHELKETGFKNIKEITLWETRKVYDHKPQLFEDLRQRTGRSILHELDDEELKSLINYIDHALSLEHNIVEKDRWTIWKAEK